MENKLKLENYEEHFTHFLLAHADRLNRFAEVNSQDFYDDHVIIEDLFLKAVEAHLKSPEFLVFGITLADVVADECFLHLAFDIHESNKYSDYMIRFEISVEDVVTVTAKSKEEAIQKFLENSKEESGLVEKLSEDNYLEDFMKIKVLNRGF